MKYEIISSKHVRRVLFCKVDLDTCLAALILNMAPFDAQRTCYWQGADGCAGGHQYPVPRVWRAGQVYRGNFDHHDTPLALAPACHQAYAYVGESDAVLERLVNYVGAVDVGPYPHVALPSLNALFSGMLFLESDPQTRLGRGIELLQMVRDLKLDPFAALPLYNAWAPFKPTIQITSNTRTCSSPDAGRQGSGVSGGPDPASRFISGLY